MIKLKLNIDIKRLKSQNGKLLQRVKRWGLGKVEMG